MKIKIISSVIAFALLLTGSMIGIVHNEASAAPEAGSAYALANGTFATSSYTNTSATMTGTITYLYDYVDIQAAGALTSSQSMTVQPLFSNNTTGCNLTTTVWATPTVLYNGLPQGSAMITITGNNPTIVRVPVSGYCFSVRLFSAGQFTPSVQYRMVKQ